MPGTSRWREIVFPLSLLPASRGWQTDVQICDRNQLTSAEPVVISGPERVGKLSYTDIYHVFHSLCIVWRHCSMVRSHCSLFRVITAVFWGFLNFSDFYSNGNKRNEPPHDKTNKMTVRPAKIQISLGICPV